MGRKSTDDAKIITTTDKKLIIGMLKKSHISYSIYHGIGGISSIELSSANDDTEIKFDFDRTGNLLKIYSERENHYVK